MTDSGYFVGQVADLLGGGKKKKKSDQVKSQEKKLAALFDVWSTQPSESKRKDSRQSKKRKKKKTGPDSLSNSDSHKTKKQNKKTETLKKTDSAPAIPHDGKSTKGGDGFCPPKGIVHESLMKETSTEDKHKSPGKRKRDEDSEDENEEDKKKRRRKHKRDKTKDKRTVFVGNIPLDCKKSAVKALFAQFGKIESVRYRCPPVSDPKVPKKVTMIKKEFHPDRSNIVSFVCFEETSAAEKALKLNGHNMDGFHLRVDLASNEKKHNKTNSVFIGNLPFDVEENIVWEHFEPCGVIENVRIVRDRKTGLGKGFGYVLFKDKSSVDLAQKLHCSKLKGREIRVDKCVDSQKMITPKHPARQRLIKKAKKLGIKPTNMRPGEKRKPKTLKKKDKSKKFRKSDPVQKVFTVPRQVPSSRKHIKFD